MTKHPRAHFLDLIHSLERFNKISYVISLLFQIMAMLNECVHSLHIIYNIYYAQNKTFSVYLFLLMEMKYDRCQSNKDIRSKAALFQFFSDMTDILQNIPDLGYGDPALSGSPKRARGKGKRGGNNQQNNAAKYVI